MTAADKKGKKRAVASRKTIQDVVSLNASYAISCIYFD